MKTTDDCKTTDAISFYIFSKYIFMHFNESLNDVGYMLLYFYNIP